MTKLQIHPGACDLPALVEVEKKDGRTFSVAIRSECEMLERLGTDIAELTLADAFTRIGENPVYRKASSILKHPSCPVPSGVLKAVEVEAGLAVAKEILMEFVETPPSEAAELV
jgi:hypothetical protein